MDDRIKSILRILEIIDHKLRDANNSENYDSEPGFTERWYVQSLKEIRDVASYEMSRIQAKGGGTSILGGKDATI